MLALLGLFWTAVEALSYFTNGTTDSVAKGGVAIGIAVGTITLVAICKNRPKTRFSYQLRDKDSFLEVKVGDAFENKGALVIPVNNCFDVVMGGNVKKSKSLLSKMISQYYSDQNDHLVTDISKQIDCSKEHDMGTTIEIEQKDKRFYLLVNSRKKPNNRVESTVDDVLFSLMKLWDYIALESGRNSVVTIPLVGTGHGRISNLTRAAIVKEIIHSYIEASKRLNIADKLIISIRSEDLKKGDIDLDEMDEYLKYSCKHYRKVTRYTEPEGTGISRSTVAHLDN